jgi:hypothetical protein
MLDPLEWTKLEETDQSHTRMTLTGTGKLRLQVLKVEKEIELDEATLPVLCTRLETSLTAASALLACETTYGVDDAASTAPLARDGRRASNAVMAADQGLRACYCRAGRQRSTDEDGYHVRGPDCEETTPL